MISDSGDSTTTNNGTTSASAAGSRTEGLVVVIAGPSGVGKTTIRQRLLDAHPADYIKSVSATTRPPRTGEVHGTNYFFLERDEFESRIAGGHFLEHAEYNQNLYGTPADFIQAQLDANHVILLDIEVQGVAQLQEHQRFPLLTFFVFVDMDELARRLEERGTETGAQIGARLHRAQIESRCMPMFDYQIENRELDACIAEIQALIERHRQG